MNLAAMAEVLSIKRQMAGIFGKLDQLTISPLAG
jgi:hypothetical protein